MRGENYVNLREKVSKIRKYECYRNCFRNFTIILTSAKCASIMRALTILKLLFIYHFVPETSCQN